MKSTISAKIQRLLTIFLLAVFMITACAPNIERLKEKGNVEKLIKALSYERSPEIRVEAALALGELGESEARNPLIELLANDEDETVRSAAAEALGHMCLSTTVGKLLGALEDNSRMVRESVESALVMCGDVALGQLTDALESEDEEFHQSIVRALAGMGDAASPSLVTLLTDTDTNVSTGAYDALVMMGSAGIPDLVEAIKGHSTRNRVTLMDILVDIGADSVEDLISLLGEENTDIVDQSVTALSEIGEPSIEPLINTLVDDDRKSQVVTTLLEIGDPAVHPLIDALSDPDLQIHAGDVLIAMGEDGIDPLIEACGNDPDHIEDFLRPLAYGLLIDSLSTQSKVEDALTQIGGTAIPFIIKAVENANRVVFDNKIILASEAFYGPYGTAEGILADGGQCTSTGEWEGQIVLCERGENYFREKVEEVEFSGGVGVIHYNNIEGNMYPSMTENHDTSIVSVGISQENGQALLAEAVGEPVQIFSRDTSSAFDVLVGFDEVAIPDLIEAVKDPVIESMSSEDFFQDVLISIGSAAVPSIIEMLEDSNENVRSSAAYMLGEIDDERCVEPLINALGDRDSWVRWQAAYSLGNLQPEEAIEPLVDLLSDEEDYVQDAALDALSSIGLPAVEYLMNQYHDETTQDTESVASALLSIFKEIEDEVAEVAFSVCSGQPLEIATKYNRYEGDYHPTIILQDDGDVDYSTYHLPVDWLPFTPETLELVVCLGEEGKQVVQVCHYYYTGSGASAPSITRYRYEQDAALYAALTGSKLGSTTLRGSQPDSCPWTTYSSTTQITGGYVTIDDLATWLSVYGIPLTE
jgi:HEAT repeat protein